MPLQAFWSVALKPQARENKHLQLPILKTFIFCLTVFSTCFGEAGSVCSPFKVHLQASAPTPPVLSVPAELPANWEKSISEKIGQIKTQESFPRIYENWLRLHPRELSENERYSWLNCLHHYASQDTNRNGIPDWNTMVDNQPARTLFPADPDQDGDTVENVLDPQPLKKNPQGHFVAGIPAHLKMSAQKRPEAHFLQERLFKEFRLLAIDHTDEHSATVLKELLFLMRKGFPKKFLSQMRTIKYFYAFAGHHHTGPMASYHWQARALSAGGIAAYPEPILKPQAQIDLLSALAHEIGHAILFEKILPHELAAVSTRYSEWEAVKSDQLKEAHYSPVFFEAFPAKHGRNIVSQYALKNRHEWFAESMAAMIMSALGKSGELSDNWQEKLIKNSESSPQYWADYTKISDDFRDWFKVLMKN